MHFLITIFAMNLYIKEQEASLMSKQQYKEFEYLFVFIAFKSNILLRNASGKKGGKIIYFGKNLNL